MSEEKTKAEESKEEKVEAKAEEKAEAKAEEAKTEAKAEDNKEEQAEAKTEEAKAEPVRKMTEPLKGNIIATAWLVLLLAMGFGSGLAGIEIWLKPIIEQNKLNEALDQIPKLVKGATKGQVDEKTIKGMRIFRATDDSGKLVGWVLNGSGQGFADRVEVLIGLDRDAKKLTGIFVLDQKETPGLGNYIVSAKKFRNQFKGLAVGQSGNTLVAKQGAPNLASGQIKALTGATISSQTVCNIINETVAKVQAKLAAAAASDKRG